MGRSDAYTTSTEEAFVHRLEKLASVVNNKDYVIRIGDYKWYGSKGIGYKNDSGQYMHWIKWDGQNDKLKNYMTKMWTSEVMLLHGRKADQEYYKMRG